MKYLLTAALIYAITFAVPAGEAHAQLRYGIEAGAVLQDRESRSYDDIGGMDITGMLFALHGEYHFRGIDIYSAPNFIVHASIDRIEVPIGAKFLFTESGIAPYVSSGLSVVYYFPITLSWSIPADFGDDYPGDDHYEYESLNMRFLAAFGVQFGSRNAPAFSLELRYNRRIGTLAGVNPPATSIDEFSVVTVFLF